MLADVATFLRYFETVHGRTVRDVAALPPGAADWRAQSDMGEGLWSLGEIVGHIASSRLMFAGAFAGRGWRLPDQSFDPGRQASWVPRLEEAWSQMRKWLEDAPADSLQRRVESMDRSARIPGWRVLMLLVEHEIHHRSQLDAYAGLAGWQVPDLFGFSFQQVQEYTTVDSSYPLAPSPPSPGRGGGEEALPGGAALPRTPSGGGSEERLALTWAARYRELPGQVRTVLAGQTDEALRRRPAPGEWSAIEVVGHLLDKMDAWRARVERIAGEERPFLPGYDQDASVRGHDYQHADPAALLDRLDEACERFAATVEVLPASALDRMGVHGETGPITLRACVEAPLASTDDHLKQARRALQTPA